MSTRNADINLVVRAKTEGEKLIESLSATLGQLFGDADHSAKGLKDLGRAVADLDKAFVAINGKADLAGAAFERQQNRITQTRAELEALTQQATNAERAVKNLGSAEAIVAAGRDGQGERLARLKAAATEQDALNNKVEKLTRLLAQQTSAIEGSRSSLQQLGSTVIAVEQAQSVAAERIAATTGALEAQANAANRAAAAQLKAAQVAETVNRVTGVTRSPATAGGASIGLLVEQFERLSAEAQRVKDKIDPVAAAIENTATKIAAVQRLSREGYISNDEATVRERQLQFELDRTIEKIAAAATAERNRIKSARTELQLLIDANLARGRGAAFNPADQEGAGFEALQADQERRIAAVRAREAEQLRATIERNARRGRGDAFNAGESNGATFSALAAREAASQAEELRAAANAYALFEAKVREGVAAMNEARRAEEADAAAVQNLRDQLEPAAAIQARMNAQLERYRDLCRAGKLTTDELAKAEKLLAAQAAEATAALDRRGRSDGRLQPKVTLFGLKPYELQNLGYQVNDVITQLASGTPLSQTLAQQGGQILQIFPRIGAAIVAVLTNPAVLAGVATFGAFALSVKEAADQAERLRQFSADLNFRADGGNYNAQALADQQRAFERLGATSEDARKAVTEFLDASVSPEKLQAFAAATQDAADGLGLKLPEAAKLVADAFTQGYQAIAELDDRLNFLTATEREHIRTLFEEGRAAEGRTEAFRIFERKADEIAEKSRGSWAQAARELRGAFSEFLDLLANTGIVQGFQQAIEGLAGAARNAIRDIRNSNDAAGTAQQVAEKRAQIADLQAKIDSGGAGTNVALLRTQLLDAQRGLATLEARLRALGGDPTAPAPAAGGDTRTNDPNSAAAKKAADRVAEINADTELQRLRDAAQQRFLTRAEQNRRAELAGQIAARGAAEAVVQAAERRRAVARETAQIEKENEARAKSAARDREQAIRQFNARVVGAEGGTKKNPHSSAVGYGQFTDSTFLEYYRKVPGLDQTLPREKILDRRNNKAFASAVIDAEARDLAKFLENIGAAVSAGNLYLLHFLGKGTGRAVLQARGDTPIDEVIRRSDPKNAAAVLSGNQGYLRTNGGKGRYRSAGELRAFIAGRVGDTGSPQTAAVVEQARLAQASVDYQAKLDQALTDDANQRQRNIDALTAENGLRDAALLAEQRKQAILDAELAVRRRVDDINAGLKDGVDPVVASKEQVDRAKAAAAALFDAAHAREAVNAELAGPQRSLEAYREQVSLLQQEAEYLRSIGETDATAAVDEQITAVNASMSEAIEALIATYESLTPVQLATLGITKEQLENLIAGLRLAQKQTQEWGKVAGVSGKEIAQAFAGQAAQSFTNFISKVAEGKNVFKALGQGVLEFAANFASAIAQMILQILAYAAAVSILRALGVPVPAGGGGIFGAVTKHGGGIAGYGAPTRNVSPAIFAAARRFHTGGIPGLGPDEVPIIARRDEEVLTAADPRHRNNGGLGSNDVQIKNINLFDPDQAAEQLLRTPAGTRAILNIVSSNPRAFKAALS